jgi:hypothetical protein
MPVDDEPGFRIRPSWPDTMVYEEWAPGDDGSPRELAFACRGCDEPPQVVVPSQALWGQRMPGWAQGRRADIMARLRNAGCVPWVFEPDGGWIESPDGRIVVRVTADHDERCGPWERITVWRHAEHGLIELVAFTNFGVGASLRFAAGGDAVIFDSLVDRGGQRQRIVVDGAAGTFAFHPDERPQPVAELDAWLGNRAWGPVAAAPSPALAGPPWRRAARAVLGTAMLLGGLVLTAGGAWMALAADTLADRLVGAVGGVFFAGCVALEIKDLTAGRAKPPMDAYVSR